MKKNVSFIKKAKEISVSSTLAFIALGTPLVLNSCGTSNDEENNEYEEYEEVEVMAKGVKTYIRETENGIFKIEKEENTAADSSSAQITYLSGQVNILTASQALSIIKAEKPRENANSPIQATLGNTLLYSGLGYFLSSDPSNNLSGARLKDDQLPNSNDSSKVNGNQHHRSGHVSIWPLFWLNRAAYSSGIASQQNMNQSRTITRRPIASRSGYFGGSRRGGFSG